MINIDINIDSIKVQTRTLYGVHCMAYIVWRTLYGVYCMAYIVWRTIISTDNTEREQ